MKLTLAEAAIGAGAVLEAPPTLSNAGGIVGQGYSIDSRTVVQGELFFAVRGERFDGHNFVAAAVERGAVAAVVSRARVATLPDAALAIPLLIAEDPLTALQALATHVRRIWGKRVVAVTGSAGKTTTKEAVAVALGAKLNVLKSKGNLNNAFGLPLQLLRLEPEHDIAVVEMGMNHIGEIAALARIAAPDWGVVTNVGTAHVENFSDGQAGIGRAKFELVEALPATGIAILNDSYNSNPEALRSMIRTLASRPASRRILVAGEMLELGEQGPALHADCGRAAVEAGLDLVIGVRGNARHLAAAACTGGIASLFVPETEEAGEWMRKNLRPGDVVLVKGSR